MVLAARGARNLDAGEEKIEDQELAAALRKKARSMRARSLIAALVLTLLVCAAGSMFFG